MPAPGKIRRESVKDILLAKRGLTSGVNRESLGMAALSEGGSSDMEGESNGWDAMKKFLSALKNISGELAPDEVANRIIKESCTLVDAERSTLFFIDAEANELILVIAEGANNIRLPIGSGLAGSVAESGESLNIPDAYEDARFSSAFDKASGFRTRAVMAVPVRDPADGSIVAILQTINKTDEGVFTVDDQMLLENFAFHVGVTLHNIKLYESELAAKTKVTSMLEVIKSMHSETTNTNSLIFTLSNNAPALVEADRCTLYLVDRPREQLVVSSGDIDVRFPMTKGIAGSVATSGKTLVIDDAYEDSRFNQEMDKQSGYRTKAILCMPIFGASKGEVIGVFQLINKENDSEVFNKDDIELMETLLSIVGPILEKSQFFEAQKGTASQVEARFESPKAATKRLEQASMGAFAEEEEDEFV